MKEVAREGRGAIPAHHWSPEKRGIGKGGGGGQSGRQAYLLGRVVIMSTYNVRGVKIAAGDKKK